MCLAIPMKVVEIIPPDRAVVESEGISMEISLKLVGDVRIDDYVRVHTGFALEIVDTAEAEKTNEIFKEIANAAKDESY